MSFWRAILAEMLDSLHAAAGSQQQAAIDTHRRSRRFMEKQPAESAETLAHPRRPGMQGLLDGSERRHHLAGTWGAA